MNNGPTTIDYINLGIAVGGAVVAIFAFGWQFVSWRLGGARIKITMKHAAYTPGGGAITFPPGGWSSLMTGQAFTQRVLAVEVINKGRMHAYVTRYGAELKNKIRLENQTTLPGNAPLPFRLEPGGSQTFFIDHAMMNTAAAIPLQGKTPQRRVRMVVGVGTGKIYRTKYGPLD